MAAAVGLMMAGLKAAALVVAGLGRAIATASRASPTQEEVVAAAATAVAALLPTPLEEMAEAAL